MTSWMAFRVDVTPVLLAAASLAAARWYPAELRGVGLLLG